jgi:4-hydroxy-tetrahydrodipicolinate reductase
MTTRVHVHGASGRMGRSIVRALAEAEGLQLISAIDRQASAVDAGTLAGTRALGVVVTSEVNAMRGDVVIDFSRSEATESLAKQAQAQGFALVVGTTGLEPSALGALDAASRVVPVIVAANTSVGVTVLAHLAELATKLLGEGFDAEIVEMHHNQKADAPSGTALRIADAVLTAKGLDRTALRTGRDGKPGPRTKTEVGVLAMRGGDVIGDHTLVLAGEGERIELTHKATDRALFAKGALRAARWIAGRAPGRYEMRDVIGL